MFTFLMSLALLQDAAEDAAQGPRKGDALPPFKVIALDGSEAGARVDIIPGKEAAPLVLVFIRDAAELDSPLLGRIEETAVTAGDRLRSAFVVLAEDAVATHGSLRESRRPSNPRSLVGVSLDGKEGPRGYRLAPEAGVTIIAAAKGEAREVWSAPSSAGIEHDGVRKVLEELSDARPGAPRTVEGPESLRALKAEVSRLRSDVDGLIMEMNALRQRVSGAARIVPSADRLEDAPPVEAPAKGKKALPGKLPEDRKVLHFLRRLIRPDASREEVDVAVRELESSTAGSPDLRRQVQEGVELADHLGFGTEYSKAARRRFRAGPPATE